MLMTIEELKGYIYAEGANDFLMTSDELKSQSMATESDEFLEAKLSAVELMIRGYTNNRFQDTKRRCKAVISGDRIYSSQIPFKAGDTVQISQSDCNDGLYTVANVSEDYFTVNEQVSADRGALCTKVMYPIDVKMGAANLIKWELNSKSSEGIASETIGRHSVTYTNMDAGNSKLGYPVNLMGFLKPYRKARF